MNCNEHSKFMVLYCWYLKTVHID